MAVQRHQVLTFWQLKKMECEYLLGWVVVGSLLLLTIEILHENMELNIFKNKNQLERPPVPAGNFIQCFMFCFHLFDIFIFLKWLSV